jgi:hypothetical protein
MLDCILRRLVDMAQADPGLRERQPWKAAHERDYAWLGKLMKEHYAVARSVRRLRKAPASSSASRSALARDCGAEPLRLNGGNQRSQRS